eukprot:1160786-Pelagomonas_calceolata.AAC.16
MELSGDAVFCMELQGEGNLQEMKHLSLYRLQGNDLLALERAATRLIECKAAQQAVIGRRPKNPIKHRDHLRLCLPNRLSSNLR